MTSTQFAYYPSTRVRGGVAAGDADNVGLLGLAHRILLYSLFETTYIGLSPLSESSVAQRAEGSPLMRFVALGMLVLSLYVCLARREQVLRCLLDNWKFLVVLAICLLSVLWSDYPDLTIRRAVLLLSTSCAALAIAVTVVDLRRFHTRLFVFMTLVIVLNLLVTVAFPGMAISSIGVKGIYPQKNVAGLVAMLTVIVAVTWCFGCKSMAGQLMGIGSALLACLFLVISRSKTSVGLLLLTFGVGFIFWVAQKLGARFALLTLAGLTLLLAILFGFLIYTDFDWNSILATFVSDTTFTGRDEIWAFAYKSAMQREWLGHGYGAFWDVGVANDPLVKLEPGTWLGDVEIGVVNQAHNGYLELWLHVGLPAMLFAVAAVFTGLRTSLRHAIKSPDLAARPTYAMMALILFVHLPHNFTEASLFMRSNPFANLVSLLIFLSSAAAAQRGRVFPHGYRRSHV